MNELGKYKDKLFPIDSGDIRSCYREAENDLKREGFDAAIALQLPIKFAKFLDEETYFNVKGYMLYEGVGEYDETEYQIDELYYYWINHVYKPE